jgi:hypothetical protein
VFYRRGRRGWRVVFIRVRDLSDAIRWDMLMTSQSPLKNALMGNLVRTLLIQVQKTKVSVIRTLTRRYS